MTACLLVSWRKVRAGSAHPGVHRVQHRGNRDVRRHLHPLRRAEQRRGDARPRLRLLDERSLQVAALRADSRPQRERLTSAHSAHAVKCSWWL